MTSPTHEFLLPLKGLGSMIVETIVYDKFLGLKILILKRETKGCLLVWLEETKGIEAISSTSCIVETRWREKALEVWCMLCEEELSRKGWEVDKWREKEGLSGSVDKGVETNGWLEATFGLGDGQ